MPSLINCVVNVQATVPHNIQHVLDCDMRASGPCHKHIDAVAIAPYFGQHVGQPEHLSTIQSWASWGESGLNHLYNELLDGSLLSDAGAIHSGSLLGVYENISAVVDMLEGVTNEDGEQIELVAYEGGQHLVGILSAQEDDQLNDLFTRFNRDERMNQLYGQYLNKWTELGGGLFVHYMNTGVYSPWGYWGAREYMQQTNSPKAHAISTYTTSFEEPPVIIYDQHVFLAGTFHDSAAPQMEPLVIPIPERELE